LRRLLNEGSDGADITSGDSPFQTRAATTGKARSPTVVRRVGGGKTCWWRESVTPLQYFCQTLQISYFIDQRKLMFWRKLAMHNNNFLLSLLRLVQNRFYAIRSLYGITTISASVGSN